MDFPKTISERFPPASVSPIERAVGTSSRSHSSRFVMSALSKTLTPVKFPLGLLRLATSANLTGSAPITNHNRNSCAGGLGRERPLTPNASIATDHPTSIPTGTITLLNVPATSACKTVSSMAVAQDIGGRIKGLISTYIRERDPPPGQRPILLTIWDLFLWRFPRGPGVRYQIACQKAPIESLR